MKLEIYNDIVTTIRNFQGLPKDYRNALKQKYRDIPVNTLYSILSLEIQHKMKVNHSKLLGNNKDYYEIYVEAVQNGEHMGVIMGMAKDSSLPPALLARHILEKHCDRDDPTVSRNEVNKLFKDTTLIQDARLSCEVQLFRMVYPYGSMLRRRRIQSKQMGDGRWKPIHAKWPSCPCTVQCILYDDLYGPLADSMGVSIGKVHERKLQDYLTEREIAFCTEEHLRSRGYDKTPDFTLEVPIAVNGFVINWIESKARFGNTEIHQKYIKEQFLSYWNRFGPGLVIYWFGFLDNLSEPSEKRFIIMDHFPENITYMDPTCM